VPKFSAYFDESGTDLKSPVTCVAGYLFTEEQGFRFDAEWRAVLDSFGIQYFHISECAHGVGQFQGKPKQECIEIETRLIGIIKRRAQIGIVVSVERGVYRRFATGELADGGGEYVLCLLWSLAGVAAWVAKHRVVGEMSYFFEAGHCLQPRVEKAMAWMRNRPNFAMHCLYHSHNFIPKTGRTAIQAADLLAWQWHRDWVNTHGSKRRPRRADFQSLLGLPHMTCHLEERHMAAIAAQGLASMEQLRRFNFVV
jgi:hypothetical protein